MLGTQTAMTSARTDRGSNKRATKRIKVDGLEGRMALVTQVEIVNISLGGISVKVDRRLTIGSECTLKLQQGKDVLPVKAVVVWSTLSGFRKKGEEQAPEYSVGMKFTHVISEEGRSIVNFINQNRSFKEQRLTGLRVEVQARGRAVLDQPAPFQVKLISLTGMLIEMNRELEADKTYPMEVMMDEVTRIHVTGRVSSQFEVAPRRHEIGVEFSQISAGDKALLKSLLQSLTRNAKK
jgi:c-di-GMP-binding flagellar brake protein YcgR